MYWRAFVTPKLPFLNHAEITKSIKGQSINGYIQTFSEGCSEYPAPLVRGFIFALLVAASSDGFEHLSAL
jgi:hypothetical protein